MKPQRHHPKVEKIIEAASRGEYPFGTTKAAGVRLVSCVLDKELLLSPTIWTNGFAHLIWANETRRRVPVQVECSFSSRLARFSPTPSPFAQVIDDLVRVTTSIRGYTQSDVFFPSEPSDVPFTVRADGTETLRCTLGSSICESNFSAFAKEKAETRSTINMPNSGKRFQIALSFPGERRAFVEKVATELALVFTKARIFYDNFYGEELARLNLDTYLQSIYHDHSDAIVVFLCSEYEKKDWCGLEWRAIRDLIKQRRSEIMLVRFDDTEVAGVFGIDGYLDATSRSPKEVASAIKIRFNL